MLLRFFLHFFVFSVGWAKLVYASEVQVIINFHDMKPDSKIENEINKAVIQLLDFSKSNRLGIQHASQFISKINVFGSKTSFDKHIESSSNWKAGSKVPNSYVGYGEKKEFFVISWPAYNIIHPTDSRSDYEKLLLHEITHLFHSAYLKGVDEKMGPVWFYEGFACFVANQFVEATLPKDSTKIINSPDRGSYRDYVALFRKLHDKHSIQELLGKAMDKDFNSWAISSIK